MTFDAGHESSVFLEAIFFSGGIRSAFYGASERPGWLPALECIGLHNDVYLSQGQHAVEVSRLKFTDGRPGTGVTWLGIYGHSTDVYGDRGNYCGVGVWYAAGVVIDVERTLRTLQDLMELLQESRPSGASQSLTPEFSSNCLEAVDWVRKSAVLGVITSRRGIPYANSYSASRAFVQLDSELNHSFLGEVAGAIDCLCLTDLPAPGSSVLFVAGDEGSISSSVQENKRMKGVRALAAGERPRLALINTLIGAEAVSRASADELTAIKVQIEEENGELKRERKVLEESLTEARQKIEQLNSQIFDAGPSKFSSSEVAIAAAEPVGTQPSLIAGYSSDLGKQSGSRRNVSAESSDVDVSLRKFTQKIEGLEKYFISFNAELISFKQDMFERRPGSGVPWTWLGVSVFVGVAVGIAGGLLARL